MGEIIVSERFCAADSDVTFLSSDGTHFKVHRKNLEATSEGFSPPDGTSSGTDELIPLSETAEVLELLFQYMYPQRQPDLTQVPFDVISAMAEAAEKYQVFAAMATSSTMMHAAYAEHPFEVLLYATKHGYPQLMDLAERESMKLSPIEAFNIFPPAVYIAWTRYYAQWQNILGFAHRWPPRLSVYCSHEKAFHEISHQLGGNPKSLLDLDFVFQSTIHDRVVTNTCDYCGDPPRMTTKSKRDNCHHSGREVSEWRAELEREISTIKQFSTFL